MWLNSSTRTTHVAHTLSFHLLLIISQFPHLPPITITTSKEDERLSQDYCDPRVFVLATPPRVWYHIWEVTWDNRWTWTVLRSSLTPSSPAQSNLLLLFVSGFLRWTGFHCYRWPLFPLPLLHPSLLLLPPRLHLLLCVLTLSLCARASLHFHTRGATQKTIFEESFRRTVLASQFKPWHHRVAVFVKIVSQHL